MDLSLIEQALAAYRHGLFPMADSANADDFHWYEARMRSLLPIHLHVPRKLRKFLNTDPFQIRVDSDFTGVIDGCAAPRAAGGGTWINPGIRALFIDFHRLGLAHSVECWRDGQLVGGIYGVGIGRVFCGESMFSRESGASKVALVHLAARLWAGGFALLDTQFLNPHLLQFGAYEISQADYATALARLRDEEADFMAADRLYPDASTLLDAYLTHI